MKLFNIFLGIFLVIFFFVAVSWFLPHAYRIEKTTVVNRPLQQSFDYMNNINNWNDWSPWNKNLDSSLVFFYSKNRVGKGARQYFRGGLYGSGRLCITNSIPNAEMAYDLWMNEGTIYTQAKFRFEPLGYKTKLIWIDSGDVGMNPIYRYMLNSKIASTEESFEQGLVTIKKAIESHYPLMP